MADFNHIPITILFYITISVFLDGLHYDGNKWKLFLIKKNITNQQEKSYQFVPNLHILVSCSNHFYGNKSKVLKKKDLKIKITDNHDNNNKYENKTSKIIDKYDQPKNDNNHIPCNNHTIRSGYHDSNPCYTIKNDILDRINYAKSKSDYTTLSPLEEKKRKRSRASKIILGFIVVIVIIMFFVMLVLYLYRLKKSKDNKGRYYPRMVENGGYPMSYVEYYRPNKPEHLI